VLAPQDVGAFIEYLDVDRTPFDKNLVQNPGAEAGAGTAGYAKVAIPHWDVAGSPFTVVRYGSAAFPTKAESQRISGGNKFFACGPDTESATARQRIPLHGRQTITNNHHLRVRFSALIASYGSQGDYGIAYVLFYAADGTELDNLRAGPVEASDNLFIRKQASMLVPAETSYMAVELVGVRVNGSYCDAFFDSVRLVLKLV